ncbi:hypothetical protein V6N11_066227 [Hibiscus sabdariffa]|uniref:Defensin-like protein n=1 Tax=Hibiscus sabdariffa TaxID=183260 RepID=A0ABR1ZIS7_9ROSI
MESLTVYVIFLLLLLSTPGQTEKTCTGYIELKDCYDTDCSEYCQALYGVDAKGKCAGPPEAECQCTFPCME